MQFTIKSVEDGKITVGDYLPLNYTSDNDDKDVTSYINRELSLHHTKAFKKYYDYCENNNIDVHLTDFSISRDYDSDDSAEGHPYYCESKYCTSFIKDGKEVFTTYVIINSNYCPTKYVSVHIDDKKYKLNVNCSTIESNSEISELIKSIVKIYKLNNIS